MKHLKKEKIIIFIISIILVMIIIPPKKHHKVNEKFYKEHGIEYNIVKCPECGRDVADVQQFCYNCGTILFDADELTIEVLNKVHENLKPTKKQIVLGMTNKILFYIVMISFVYLLIDEIVKKIIKKIRLKIEKK